MRFGSHAGFAEEDCFGLLLVGFRVEGESVAVLVVDEKGRMSRVSRVGSDCLLVACDSGLGV